MIPGLQHKKPGSLSPSKDPVKESAMRSTADIFGASSLNKSYDYINGRQSRGNGHSNLAARGGYLPSVREYTNPNEE